MLCRSDVVAKAEEGKGSVDDPAKWAEVMRLVYRLNERKR